MSGMNVSQRYAGPAEGHAQDEERVDAHHRGQVGERDREVLEESEHSVELGRVAEALESRVFVWYPVGDLGGRYVRHRSSSWAAGWKI